MTASLPSSQYDLFREWIHYQIEQSGKNASRKASEMLSEWNRRGATGSGRFPIYIFELFENHFKELIDTILYECTRKLAGSGFFQEDFLTISYEELDAYRLKIESTIPMSIGGLDQNYSHLIPKLKDHLEFAFRQYRAGNLVPGRKESPLTMTNNTITFHGSATNVTIQQDSAYANQHQQLDHAQINASLEELQQLLDDTTSIQEADRLAIRSDIATIRAQLQKPTPNRTILAEGLASMRTIIESIVADAISPTVLLKVQALSHMIGLT